MKRKIWELMNSTAAEPFMFCSADGDGDDEGGEGDGAGGDNGGTGGKSGDEGGAGGDGKGGKPGSKLGRSGLFSQRSGGGDSGAGNGDGGNDDEDPDAGKPDADGRPKGLADKFWDPDKKTIRVDALVKANQDAERAIGELRRQKGPGGGEVPKTADEYFKEGVTLPDTVERLTITPDDPGLKAWAEICKEEGIGKDLAKRLMTNMFVRMDQFAPDPVDPVVEMKALGKGGPQMVDGLFAWVEGMERAGDVAEDDLDVIEGLMQTAKGARFLAKMRNMTGEEPIPVNPGGGAAGMSLDQLDAKFKEAVKNKDYAEQERLDALRDRINPDGQQPGISGRAGGYSI